MIFFENYAKLFLKAHLAASIIVFVIMIFAFFYLALRSEPDWRIGRKLTLHSMIGYIIIWASGLLIYPVFRVRVRNNDFDINNPWLVGLFEIKEHISSIGLFLAIALIVLSLAIKIKDADKTVRQTYVSLLAFVLIIYFSMAAIAIYLTARHSI